MEKYIFGKFRRVLSVQKWNSHKIRNYSIWQKAVGLLCIHPREGIMTAVSALYSLLAAPSFLFSFGAELCREQSACIRS
jgi:hypothetical protein